LLVRFKKWNRAVTSGLRLNLLLKWTCTKLTNPAHETWKCGNPYRDFEAATLLIECALIIRGVGIPHTSYSV